MQKKDMENGGPHLKMDTRRREKKAKNDTQIIKSLRVRSTRFKPKIQKTYSFFTKNGPLVRKGKPIKMGAKVKKEDPKGA